jgi:hypothetical protein
VTDPGDVVGLLEASIDDLAHGLAADEPEWFEDRLAEFLGESRPGWAPSDDDVREASLWLLFDCPLPDGRSPIERLAARSGGRAGELLARSELRAWLLEGRTDGETFTALCPLGSGRARLEHVRPAAGDPRPGALLVGRSVPTGPQRWTLLARPRLVPTVAAPAFSALLASLEAPVGEFWRVHGGVLARTAMSLSSVASPGSSPNRAQDPDPGTRARAPRGTARRQELALERIASVLRRSRGRAA